MKLWRSSRVTAQERFDRDLLPHLDSAYNLARWLTKNEDDASDVVQESFVKAFRHIDQLIGEDAKPWLLAIVRNTAHRLMTKRTNQTLALEDQVELIRDDGPSPEEAAFRTADKEVVNRLLDQLPVEFREVVVLRELEDLSYKEISEVIDVPVGTVMSRLSRARQRLQTELSRIEQEEGPLGL